MRIETKDPFSYLSRFFLANFSLEILLEDFAKHMKIWFMFYFHKSLLSSISTIRIGNLLGSSNGVTYRYYSFSSPQAYRFSMP